MSEEKRKNARTQSRYSGGDKDCSSNWQDKRSPKMHSTDKNKGEKRKSPIVGSKAQTKTDLQFDENSNYSFKDLEPLKKPQKIHFIEPVHELSNTINGISRLIYYPDFIKSAEANNYFDILLNTTLWHDKNIVIKGVEYPQPRLVAWYGPHPYTYAGATLEARKMPTAVLEIKERIEATLRKHAIKVELNSVLLNLYRNEKDSVSWHSDDELSLGIHPTIASVSLGATRKFEMRLKEHVRNSGMGDISYVDLTHGSLIIMDGCMQKDWQHRVPKEYHGREKRINLTFRTIYPLDKLPPEMPCVSQVKSPSEKALNHQDPKFDSESFPPLGRETSDKKTKLLPKENGKKDYKQSFIQRKSPKEYCEVINQKTKFLPKGSDKGYQKSVVQKNYQKGENWDDSESFPPLGMKTNDKKTKLSKENDIKDYKQSVTQRRSPKGYCEAIGKKTKFLPKGSDKGYQKSIIRKNYQKEENWDDTLQNIESTPTIYNNQNSSYDSIINSSEFHQRQIDQKEENWDDELLQNIESMPTILNNLNSSCDSIINSPEFHQRQINQKIESRDDESFQNIENMPTIVKNENSSYDSIINQKVESWDDESFQNIESTPILNNQNSSNDSIINSSEFHQRQIEHKEENWDDESLQNIKSIPTILNNQNSSYDSINNSPEFHQRQIDQKVESWDDESFQNIESTPTIVNNQNPSYDSIINSPEFLQRQIDQKEENCDYESLQNIESKPNIQSNQKLCCDPLIDKPGLHSSKIDSNLNFKMSTKLCNMKFSSSDFIENYDFSDSSKMCQLQNYESTNNHLYESEDASLSKSRSVDFNSNNEDIEKSCIKSEFQLDSSKIYQSNEPTDSPFMESKGPSLSEKNSFKIKSEFVEIDANISDSGKISMLNANAPDFIPQNKFENFSLSDLAERGYRLKTEEFHVFSEEIFKRVYADGSPLFKRDFYELDVYCKLIAEDSLSDTHLNIILKRVCSIVKHAYKRLNDTRYTDRYVHRSYDENSHYKYKQSYGRSPRY